MKIRTVDTYPLLYRLPAPYGDANGLKTFRSTYLIRIETDDGVSGWGECADALETLHKGFHDRIIPELIGQPANDRRKLVRTVKKHHARAASAVGMALSEIAALRAGMNLCDAWGGRFRDKVPVYASFQSYSAGADWQKRSVAAVEQAAAAGFDAFKVKIGGKSVDEDQRHIAAVQAALSGDPRLALDANQSYDAAAALAWRPLLERMPRLLWLEEPLQIRYAAAYSLLRQRLPVPLAGGENLETAADFLPLLARHALDYITPDPLHVTGIDEYRETLGLARAFGIRATPHAFDGALTRLYALFAQACLEPFGKMQPDAIEPVEWDAMDNPFTRLVPLRPAGGEVAVPGGTGIGIEIDTDLLAFYRWDGSRYE
ncbi:D-galactarolactone cycloisomerase [Paenibacillus sp. UNC496MF]|uniref:mandelate racemase/muconate lactonizing enzyme family protein n=1 Tax=Paenibacillus sp. UNC496MF TaxID=1502753 RepID=UPI0008F450F2|nr:mandelate racemase/muconate lactonizing enzyme family protein [Paenibacillus sp. UNC496MF]SFJ35856.1 D-galactarolactone cycloisomerase [Paenibacillus sp. UNC496MF]